MNIPHGQPLDSLLRHVTSRALSYRKQWDRQNAEGIHPFGNTLSIGVVESWESWRDALAELMTKDASQ